MYRSSRSKWNVTRNYDGVNREANNQVFIFPVHQLPRGILESSVGTEKGMAFPAWLDKRKGGERGNSFNERASELIHGIHLQRDANYGLYGSIVTDVRQHALQIIINRAILAHRLIAPIIRSKISDLSTRVKEETMRRRVASSMMDRNPRGNGFVHPRVSRRGKCSSNGCRESRGRAKNEGISRLVGYFRPV